MEKLTRVDKLDEKVATLARPLAITALTQLLKRKTNWSDMDCFEVVCSYEDTAGRDGLLDLFGFLLWTFINEKNPEIIDKTLTAIRDDIENVLNEEPNYLTKTDGYRHFLPKSLLYFRQTLTT